MLKSIAHISISTELQDRRPHHILRGACPLAAGSVEATAGRGRSQLADWLLTGRPQGILTLTNWSVTTRPGQEVAIVLRVVCLSSSTLNQAVIFVTIPLRSESSCHVPSRVDLSSF